MCSKSTESKVYEIAEPKLLKPFLIATIGVLLAIFPFVTPSYWIVLAFTYFTNLALAQSWNLAGGYCNLISLGQGAFVGIGGYITFMLYFSGVPLGLGLVVGACLAGGLAALLSTPLFRLRGIYFTIGTLALGEIIKLLVVRLPQLGGSWGLHITSIPPYYSPTFLYYLALICAVVTILAVWKIAMSKTGWALKCIRSDEDACELIGVDTYRYKVYAFTIHAFLSGLTGGVLSLYTLHIEPFTLFSVSWSLTALMIVILGGRGTFLGPFFGATIMLILSHFLAVYYTAHLIILGVILIIVILYYPDGIMGVLQKKLKLKHPWGV